MYLKSIDVQGFKSFPDKIKIAFDDGVTVIVGPNGSGKSNICDAIRWVLGEQSSRTLRGLKMEDVIFNGTQKRSAVGFAEVSLTIDNKEGILKSDYDEITVTRRFYRSGESEYYINRTQVRLKDIHELFMDTGLGRDGYSIVGQGRIAEIMSAKSEDRRQIFEEAAGIIKFRTRKEEAQKKLSGTEDNIVRINDIIAELEGRIEPLSIASQKAKQYLEFYEELKNLEINQWLAEINHLNETVERCGREYESALADLKKSESEANSIDSQIEELYEDMRSKDAQAERARGHIKELEQQLSDITAKVAVLQNDAKNDQTNVDRIEKEIEREQNRSGSIDEEIEGLQQKIQNIAQGITEDENSLRNLQLHSTDLSSKEQGVDSEISRKSAHLAELIALVSDLKISISALGATLLSNEERKKALTEEAASSGREKDRLAKDLSDTEREKEEQKNEIEAADNVYNGYHKKQENAQKRYEDAFTKSQEMAKQIEAKRARLILLTDLQKDYDGYTKSVKMVMQQRETGRLKGIIAPVSRLIQSGDEYATAIEIALGAASQNIVVENEQSAKAVISYLKSTEGGRATFMPLSSVSGAEMNTDIIKTNAGFIGMASSLVKFDPRFSGIIQNLLGRTAVVDHIDNGLAMASQNNYRLRIVTLDGQLLNPGGSITGGSLNKNFGLLSRANEIEHLKYQLSLLQEDYKTKSREETFYKQELDKINAQLEGCVMQKTRAMQLLEVLEAKSTGLRSNLELFHVRLDAALKEQDAIVQKDRQTNELIKQNQNKSEELSAAVEQINESVRLLQTQKSDVTDLKEELSQKIMELKLDINSKKKDIESAQSAIGSLVEQKETAAVSRERFTEQITQLCCKIEEIKEQINSHNKIMEELKASVGSQEELVQSLIQKKLLSEQKISGLQKESTGQRNLLLSLQKEYARCEGRLTAAKSAEDTIINKMWDSYEISLTAAKKYLNSEIDLSRAPKRISTLKAEIKGLGNVNIDSIEEYREVKERYAFITAQRDDLTRAKEGLLEIVCEMTEKMKTMFKSQFSVISEEFSKTFIELFGGGKASLVLSDPDDVLESGIEINVQPPGKNVKNLSLLSGGEQAFVAIAILFAILKIKPTPFCVFDEIEAALDDVNVARFANYIEKYSEKTQFILISHRRGTMEAADILYGVTMQERGVSKLLSININEVERRFNLR